MGLAFHPGEVEIHLITQCYGNQCKFGQYEPLGPTQTLLLTSTL